MWRGPLDIDDPAWVAIGEHQISQAHQRALGRIRRVMKHRLTREKPSDGQPVKAADQLTLAPRLDRVSPSQVVQTQVCIGDRRGDPGSLPCGIGTARHYCRECRVDADLEVPQRLPQGPANPHLAGQQNTTRVRRPPSGRWAAVLTDSHREQPGAIGHEQRARLEIGADAHQVVPRGGPVLIQLPA